MRSGLRLVLGLFALPQAVQAQAPCDAAARGDVPACMVGTWSGDSDMAEKLDAFLSRLPENVWASADANSGRFLFMRVERDGYYITSPLTSALTATILDDEGVVGTLRANLETGGSTGLFFQAPDQHLSFCSLAGAGFMTMSGDDGGSATMPMGGAGSAGMMPEITYTCGGDHFDMMVHLPDPIGVVTYSMTRIPDAAIPDALRDLLPRRD